MLSWQLKKFKDLTLEELYAILRVRQEVFVLEQNCAFVDADNNDQPCHHLSGYVGNEIAAYARIVPPGAIYEEPSIGRVITSGKYRRDGYGKLLMQKAIEETEKLYGKRTIKIGAQIYLEKFYGGFGFVSIGEPYLEDGIVHTYMLRESK